MRWLNKALYIIIAIGAYIIAFNDYVPSDVTMGLWLKKPTFILPVAAVITFFATKRLAGIFFFSAKEERARRVAMTLLLLPSYCFISLFIVIDINGLLDDKTRTITWRTNLVYFKDVEAACVSAGIDDAQLAAGSRIPGIIFVPRHICPKIQSDELLLTSLKHPYNVTISAGKFGIPYIIDIAQVAGAQ